MSRSCCLVATLLLGVALTDEAPCQYAPFVRADSNIDGSLDISDPVFTLLVLFTEGGFSFPCLDAADANGNAEVDIADPVFTLQFLFLGGERPPAPFPDLGHDDDGVFLGCERYGDVHSRSIVADHTRTELDPALEPWVEEAKQTFRIYYGHTSHGSQIPSGMAAMRNDVYDYSGFQGVIQDQNLLFIDASLGHWICRNCNPCARLNGVAAIAELHYTTTMNDTDSVGSVTNPFNRLDILNASGALNFQLGHTALRVGAAAPLTNSEEKLFDAEVIFQLNRNY